MDSDSGIKIEHAADRTLAIMAQIERHQRLHLNRVAGFFIGIFDGRSSNLTGR
jgi:hypothetical protein